MINIITSFYIPSADGLRENELKRALNRNLNNPFIKKIHLFLDKESDEAYIKSLEPAQVDKIKIVRIGPQPLYSELFSYANTLPNEICMICNGDIWVAALQKIKALKTMLENGYIFSITRHEMTGYAHLIDNAVASYDAFVFKTRLNPLLPRMIQHKQNLWGAENRVIDALLYLRYNVINPCIQFKIVHEHDMNRRNRIENNRITLKHNGNVIKPILLYEQNNSISIRKYISNRFKMFNI